MQSSEMGQINPILPNMICWDEIQILNIIFLLSYIKFKGREFKLEDKMTCYQIV